MLVASLGFKSAFSCHFICAHPVLEGEGKRDGNDAISSVLGSVSGDLSAETPSFSTDTLVMATQGPPAC